MIFLAIYKITNCWWIPINSHHIPSAYPLFFFTESLSRNEDSLLRLRLRDLLHLRCRCRRGWDRRLGRPQPRRRRGPWRCRVAWAWRFEGKPAENHVVLPWKLEVSCRSSSKSSSMKIQGWWMNGLNMKHARLYARLLIKSCISKLKGGSMSAKFGDHPHSGILHWFKLA
jgi:hypothetical protein